MEAASTSWRSLGELFVERGLISEADLERALAEQVATKRRLADILVRRGLVTGHDITSALMEQLGTKPAALPRPAKKPSGPAAAAAAAAPAPVPVPEPVEVVPLPEPPRPAPEPAPAAVERIEPAPAAEPEPRPFEASAPPVSSISAHALIAEADARRRGAEAALIAAREAHAQVIRGIEQVRTELEARDLPADGLARELKETQARLRIREEELANTLLKWEEARREAERCGSQLAELQGRLDEKEHELSEASASAAAWAARSSELENEADALAVRVDAAVAALENLAATRFAGGADLTGQAKPTNGSSRKRAAVQAGVLYFVPKAEGYDLIEREGELPAVGEAMEFGEQQYVVTKLGRSPLPFDRRACVFLTAV